MTTKSQDDPDGSDKRSGPAGLSSPGPLNNPASPVAAVLLGGVVTLGAVAGWFHATRGEAEPPAIALVAPEQFAQAVATLSPQGQANAQKEPRQCRYPMGVITVSTPGNAAGGTISFRTS